MSTSAAVGDVLAVDALVDARVLPHLRPIVSAIRSVMKTAVPEAVECITKGTPGYPGNLAFRIERIIAVISPTKQGITLAFSKGASFNDRFGLLEGAGKVSKNVRMRRLEDINEAAIRDYLEQARQLDSR